MPRILSFWVIFALLAASVVAEYSQAYAHHSMELACVAYCNNDELVDSWSCPMCKQLPQIDYAHSIRDDAESVIVVIMTEQTDSGKILHVAFRGTVDIKNWVEDFKAWQEKFDEWPECKVHDGFARAYRAVEEQIRREVQLLMAKGDITAVRTTGHSLGGAIATLCAVDLRTSGIVDRDTFLGTYTFGEPRVGNPDYVDLVEGTLDEHYRVVHWQDLVPMVPPHMLGIYHHAANEVWYNEDMSDYRICDGSGEDPTCSLSQPTWVGHVDYSIDCHLHYLGIFTSECVCS
ncbi:Lipase (class 3) [Carpediemonas membranifera]|uniref:Lipase (Class 3) n=1 Tax=Carpediemonas membranifera TaxID=201153 RepID=A0A8J6AZC3_9EUKA|nr:Lipase (class 3) [Carpediemonas membranifera]|eukprot:KAG9392088.1 Lipase (class 3) [Carpediemonas membranifera]